MKREHKAKKIPLKMIDVDVKIIPLIEWLNARDGVTTLFSCQGSKVKEKPQEIDFDKFRGSLPYVLFTCDSDEDLISIMKSLSEFDGGSSFSITSTQLTVEYYSPQTPIRYHLVFRHPKILDAFLLFLKTGKNIDEQGL